MPWYGAIAGCHGAMVRCHCWVPWYGALAGCHGKVPSGKMGPLLDAIGGLFMTHFDRLDVVPLLGAMVRCHCWVPW